MSYRDYVGKLDLYGLQCLADVINERRAKLESENRRIVWRVGDRAGWVVGNYREEDYVLALKCLAREAEKRYIKEIESGCGSTLSTKYLTWEVFGEKIPASEYDTYEFDTE